MVCFLDSGLKLNPAFNLHVLPQTAWLDGGRAGVLTAAPRPGLPAPWSDRSVAEAQASLLKSTFLRPRCPLTGELGAWPHPRGARGHQQGLPVLLASHCPHVLKASFFLPSHLTLLDLLTTSYYTTLEFGFKHPYFPLPSYLPRKPGSATHQDL